MATPNARQEIPVVRDVDQTSAPRALVVETCSPDLSTVDALSVGLSLRALARQRHMPAGTAEIYDRVGKQLVAAARLAMTGGGR